eukprot:231054-Chlamydomonas_euryale.AAC.1
MREHAERSGSASARKVSLGRSAPCRSHACAKTWPETRYGTRNGGERPNRSGVAWNGPPPATAEAAAWHRPTRRNKPPRPQRGCRSCRSSDVDSRPLAGPPLLLLALLVLSPLGVSLHAASSSSYYHHLSTSPPFSSPLVP